MKRNYNLTETIDFVTTSETPVELLKSLYQRRDFKLWLQLLTRCYGDLSEIVLDRENMTNPYNETSLLTGMKLIEAGLSLVHSDDEATKQRSIKLIEQGLGAFDETDKALLLDAFYGKNSSLATDSILVKAFPDFFESEEV